MSQLQLLLRRPNLLAYPGTLPGFDPLHPASKSIAPNFGFSAIASGGNGMLDLFNGNGSIVTGATAFSLVTDGIIGNAIKFPPSGTGWLSTPNASWGTSPPGATFALILKWDDTTGAGYILQVAQDHLSLLRNGANGIEFFDGATEFASNLLPTAGVPYFVIATTVFLKSCTYLMLNLKTGQIQTKVLGTGVNFSPASTGSPGGKIGLANGVSSKTSIAACMAAPNFMTLPQMLLWAQDPWSFWYPQKFDLASSLGLLSAGGGSSGSYPQDIRGFWLRIRDIANTGNASMAHYGDDIFEILKSLRDLLNTNHLSTAAYTVDELGMLQNIRDLLNTGNLSTAAYSNDVLGVTTNIRDLLNSGSASTGSYPAGYFGILQAACDFAVANGVSAP